jgi:hypothetical protein
LAKAAREKAREWAYTVAVFMGIDPVVNDRAITSEERP